MKAVTLGDARSYTHALVDTLANTLSEVEVVGEERGDAHALVNKLADTLAEEEGEG